ncbi:MAG: trigger factor [Candidatus Nomurabacteria bacterium]|jgi:trigger factor|nr:trigger factor [Candidatus Nomurabacteria bacterium]
MKASIKKISDVKVEITVVLDRSDLEPARLKALEKLAGEVKVAGFRSGKAPSNLVEKHVDPNRLASVSLEQAIGDTLWKTFSEQKIAHVGRPDVVVKKYVPGESAEYTATVEKLPEINLGDYKKLKAKKDAVKVSEKEIEAVLSNIQKGFAEKKVVRRKAKLGDEVVIDFTGRINGEPFEGGKAKDFKLELGSKTFIAGFEEAVVGHESGDKFDIKTKFPKDYRVEACAGKDVVFETLLKQVNEVVLPKIDNKLAEKSGPFKTLKELKEDVKANITHQKEHEATEKYKDALILELAGNSKVVAPEVLVEDQKRLIRQDIERNLQFHKMTLAEYLRNMHKTEAEWEETEVNPLAEKRVRMGLTVAKLAAEFKVAVTDEEVAAKIAELKVVHKNNEAVLKQLETPEVRADIRNRLTTEKAVEELVRLNLK